MQSWTETRLWKQLASLSSPERSSVEGLLQQWMPEIERVLNAGTSPLDFTLHDAEHSFRVAEWMAKIVPEGVLGKLSAYELALLLLSAYLHDIGMTPEQARVQRHWRHLVFGPLPEEEGGLSQEEAAEFQRWLDDEEGGLVPPLAREGKAGEDDLRLAAELITYYARHKHNDWSGEWIRQYATGALGSYEGWVEDLVPLCQSHHQGYADLLKESFDPRPVGRHGEVVHLRYLACILRVADILDVDPERTPPVLFQHRDIALKSVIYWWKDHDFWVNPDGSTLVIHARPRSAIVEKAVRDTAEWIRLELETCARLDREKPFSHSSFRASEPLPHQWIFPDSIQLQVRPPNDDYVYIDGAFRPNTAKLLELLSGIQLYQEPLAAVRELLQNAFDAVKEQIALERLAGDPADSKRTDAITALQSVELRFEEKDGRSWLFCTDSGVGMTRSIIENYLLVSGSSRRHDILELDRRCEAAGFHLGRTGQFGIGVLSYFMLADRVEIRTRRSSARSDAETHGWQFQTEGVGAFGELRKDFQGRRGTTVGLRLRQEVAANREDFLSRLQEYLLETLLRLPCSFRLVVEGEDESRLRLEEGWQPLETYLVNEYIRQVEGGLPPVGMLRSDRERRNLALSEWAIVAERLRSAIRWETEVGTLPGGIGHYRLSVPFFILQGGRSGLFFDFDPEIRGLVRPLSHVGTLALALQPKLRTSFHGMNVQSAPANRELFLRADLPYLAEIDWEGSQAGQITVDRSTFSTTTEAFESVSWLKSRGEELQAMILSKEPSEYAELNAALNPRVPSPPEAWWFVNAPDREGLRWEPLSLPAVSGSSLSVLRNAVQAICGDRSISIAQSFQYFLNPVYGGVYFEWDTGNPSRVYPNRLAVVSKSPLIVIPEYVVQPQKANKVGGLLQCEFPHVWSSIAAVEPRRNWDNLLWNRDHHLFQTVAPEDLEWFTSFRLEQLSEDLLQTRGRSALYLMKVLMDRNRNTDWHRELAEDFRPGFWRELWDCLALDPAEIVAWIQQSNGKGELLVFSPEGLESIPATDPEFPSIFRTPGRSGS